MNLTKEIIQYIAMTQPKLEKMAQFQTKLAQEVKNAYRCGIFNAQEANDFYKEAVKSPSKIFEKLSFPITKRNWGTSTGTTSSSKYDALADWLN